MILNTLSVVSDLCAIISKYTAGFKIIIEPFDERLPNVRYSYFILTLLSIYSCFTYALLVLYYTLLTLYSYFTHTLLGARPDPARRMPGRLACDEGRL